MSYGGKDAFIPDDLMQKVHSTNSGVLTNWAPQQTILAHPVSVPHYTDRHILLTPLTRSPDGSSHTRVSTASWKRSSQVCLCARPTVSAYLCQLLMYVRRICWPYMAEQPLNTMHLTDNLGIAYEVVEIRTGENATKTTYRTGRAPVGTLEAVRAEASEILDKAFGEDGKIKRANIMKLREEALSALGPEGSTRKDLERLLDEMHA